jgi:DNA-binding transcriptional LysR family regulator
MMLPSGAPELADLDLLLCVERLGSLNKAAREHCVSQPTASLRIQAVERRLGVRLLDRSPAGCELTPAGRDVAKWARAVVEAAEELVTRTGEMRTRNQARLRIAASQTVADHLIPSWLITLRRQQPELAVELQVHNAAEVSDRLSASKVDVGFVEAPVERDNLCQAVVGRDELAVVVAPDHPLAARSAPLTVEEMMREPLVLSERGASTRETFERAFGTVSGAHANIEVASPRAIKAAAMGGIGAGVLTLLDVREELRTGALVKVALHGVDLTYRLLAVWSAGAELPASVSTLVRIASDQIGPRRESRVGTRAANRPACAPASKHSCPA